MIVCKIKTMFSKPKSLIKRLQKLFANKRAKTLKNSHMKNFNFLLTLLFLFFILEQNFSESSLLITSQPTYIFATFTGDDANGMKLQIYTSTDALNYNLYSNTLYSGPAGCSLRDPSIMKYTDGRYYIVFTAPPYNNPYAYENIVGMAYSNDLKTWTSLPSISTDTIGGGVKNSWAPEWVVDDNKTPRFIVHCSSAKSDLRPYLFTALDTTLTKWSAPVDIGIGAVYLDGQIVKYNNVYHCFIKTTPNLRHATAPTITGPWTWQPDRSDWANMEGPCVIKLTDGTWRMYVDPMYGPAAYANSTDLYNWSVFMNLPGPGNIIRHGTVIRDTTFNIPAPPVVQPVNPGNVNLTHQWKFDDGTANDVVGTANGILRGGATITNNALKMDAAGQYLELPASQLGISAYSEFTMAGWFTSKTGTNTGNTMLCYFGNTLNDMGSNGCFISVARPDNSSRAAISCGNTTAPWNAESYVSSARMDDGLSHFVAGVITSTDISYYVDGVNVGTSSLSGSNSLSNIILNYAYLGRSGYTSDPTWLGSIDKFSIYNKALSVGEVLYLYQNGISTDISKTMTDNLNIFPNPAGNYISIRGILGKANVEIIDLQGRKLISMRNIQSNQPICIENLTTGSYLIRISTKDETIMKKILRK